MTAFRLLLLLTLLCPAILHAQEERPNAPRMLEEDEDEDGEDDGEEEPAEAKKLEEDKKPKVEGGKPVDPKTWVFSFNNGDRIHGELIGMEGEKLLFRNHLDPKEIFAIPIMQIQGAWRLSEETKEGVEAEEGTGPTESLWLRDGSILHGRFVKLGKDSLDFNVDGVGVLNFDWKMITEFRHKRAPAKIDPNYVEKASNSCVVLTTEGDVLIGKIKDGPNGTVQIDRKALSAQIKPESISVILFPNAEAKAKTSAEPGSESGEDKKDEEQDAKKSKPESRDKGEKPEDKKPEDKKPEDKKPEDKKSEGKKPEEKKPEAAKPEDKKPATPEEKKAEPAKPESPKPEDKKPEDKKPEEKKPEDATDPKLASGKDPKADKSATRELLGLTIGLGAGASLQGTSPRLVDGLLSFDLSSGQRISIKMEAVKRFSFTVDGNLQSSHQVLVWNRFADLKEEYPNTLKGIKTLLTGWNVVETNTDSFNAAFKRQLMHSRVLLIPEPEKWAPADAERLAQELKTMAPEFLRRGGNIVMCAFTRDQSNFLRDAGLLDVTERKTVDGQELKFSEAGRPLQRGVKEAVRALNATYSYEINKGIRAVSLAEVAGGNAVIIGRRVGRGWCLLLGMDFYERSDTFDRILVNACQMP